MNTETLPTERIGDCFQTFSGNPFYPFDLYPHEIIIDDIAHALSNTCRFGGHCRHFYSVAQHSVKVICIVSSELALQALLHDAAEAYIGDMVKPFKNMIIAYEEAEEVVWYAVAKKFNLPRELHPDVKKADRIMLATEARDLMQNAHPCWAKWLDGVVPIPEHIYPISPHIAESLFMERFNELTRMQCPLAPTT